MTTLRVLAPAKLNLLLRVLAREASGFHQIETLFCTLQLADELDIALGADGLKLDVLAPPESAGATPDLGPVEQNLAWRAAVRFFAEIGQAPAAAIRLTKRIPAGAGLGGGSSDAAAVLKALNSAHDDVLDLQRLLELGAELGSDVPFFVAGSAMAFAWGRGGRLAPQPPLPSLPVLLAVPSTRIATAAAYQAISEGRESGYLPAPALLTLPLRAWSEVGGLACNDFEEFAFAQLPQLAALRQALEDQEALIARMTGSGSVVFGLFQEVSAAEQAQAALKGQFPEVSFILTRTAAGTAAADS